MSYRIEAATKEEWAERALSGEKKLDDLKDSIKELFSLLDVTEAALAAARAAYQAELKKTKEQAND